MKTPDVTIVLPTYNRSQYLVDAIDSIQAQTYEDWELIIVDDGSTDDTQEVVERESGRLSQPIKYIYQDNHGPAIARNTGIDAAGGKYVAFFDSDDQWLPHHLRDCVTALEVNTDIDWVYGAGRRVHLASGEVLVHNSFRPNGEPLPFLSLNTQARGNLKVIDDERAKAWQLRYGLYCGLQNSVLRRNVFDQLRLPPFRIAEDRLFTVMAIEKGVHLAYFDDVHVVYHVHNENTSDTMSGSSVVKRRKVQEEVVRCYEATEQYAELSRAEKRALGDRLSKEYFWHLGYAILWRNNCRREALQMFRRGLRLRPFDLKCWKTYLACLGRCLFGVKAT